jgi:hypothetical protein
MLLAPIFLAAALGQCPAPPGRDGPPPCAASNVPGCVPGYVRDHDRQGRVIYRCDPAYRAPGAAVEPQQPWAQSPPPAPEAEAGPPAYAPPPPSYPAPPPSYAAPPPPRYQPRYAGGWQGPPPERRGMLGLVLMPGATTFDRNRTNDTTGALGLELRGPFGGARLRGLFEYTRDSRIWDASLKYDFNDRGEIRPFLAVGLGGADLRDGQGFRPTGAISAGVDLYFARDLFLTVELKQRAFTQDGPDGWQGSALHQSSIFAGVGIYL